MPQFEFHSVLSFRKFPDIFEIRKKIYFTDFWKKCTLSLIFVVAESEAVNYRGQTPLHVAAASSQGVDCLESLLRAGASINVQSEDGRTPLHMTAIHGRFTRSKSLLDAGASPDTRDKNGNTALHVAAWYEFKVYQNRIRENESSWNGNIFKNIEYFDSVT